jgi:hypothetical protein
MVAMLVAEVITILGRAHRRSTSWPEALEEVIVGAWQ